MNIGHCATVLQSMNFGHCATVLQSMNIGHCATVLQRVNIGHCATVLTSEILNVRSDVDEYFDSFKECYAVSIAGGYKRFGEAQSS